MSRRYTADGKRLSSQTHAMRVHYCSCGLRTNGNGGKSSHRKKCSDGYWLSPSEVGRLRVAECEAAIASGLRAQVERLSAQLRVAQMETEAWRRGVS